MRDVITKSRVALSQWEMALLCNNVSHWLGASLESALDIQCGPLYHGWFSPKMHDNVKKLKYFPHYWPFVSRIHPSHLEIIMFQFSVIILAISLVVCVRCQRCWDLFAESLAVIGWCFNINQSQTSFLQKSLSSKPLAGVYFREL